MHARLLLRASTAFLNTSFTSRAVTAGLMAFFVVGVAWLVHATGGVRFAYVHVMYIPVVLSGLAFGVPGGMLAGIAGGLLLGPLMPLDTSSGELQETYNWAYRLAFFAFIGLLVGTGQQLLRRHLRHLQWLHEHYESTGVLNQAGLIRELNGLIRRTPQGERLMVASTQLNAFLEIQNTFGAGFGLRLLGQVVERAKRLAPPGSLVALIQPDRLAIVVQREAASEVTPQRVEEAVKESYMVDGVPIHVEASVGVAYFPEHAQSAEELLQKASIAMHWATSSKSALSIYDSANDRSSRDNLILLGALPDAIGRGELRCWHQAKLALASGRIAGAEALLRWQHPQRGMVPPGLFIPQTEETTLINPVTQVVIATAFADAATWRTAGHRLRISVNLSVRNLHDHMLFDVIEQNLRRNDLEPADIELEITESAVMADPQYCIRLIAQLRERGYGVSIDDFGTGHSSLAYLQKLRLSALKIDQAFVKLLASDANSQKIVRSILHLAKSLGLETVAEGVEQEEALALLREWGCDYGQGYAIHRPAPSQDLLHFLKDRPPATLPAL